MAEENNRNLLEMWESLGSRCSLGEVLVHIYGLYGLPCRVTRGKREKIQPYEVFPQRDILVQSGTLDNLKMHG